MDDDSLRSIELRSMKAFAEVRRDEVVLIERTRAVRGAEARARAVEHRFKHLCDRLRHESSEIGVPLSIAEKTIRTRALVRERRELEKVSNAASELRELRRRGIEQLERGKLRLEMIESTAKSAAAARASKAETAEGVEVLESRIGAPRELFEPSSIAGEIPAESFEFEPAAVTEECMVDVDSPTFDELDSFSPGILGLPLPRADADALGGGARQGGGAEPHRFRRELSESSSTEPDAPKNGFAQQLATVVSWEEPKNSGVSLEYTTSRGTVLGVSVTNDELHGMSVRIRAESSDDLRRLWRGKQSVLRELEAAGVQVRGVSLGGVFHER